MDLCVCRMIFWTDVGFPVAVWRAGLDGEQRIVLIGSGLVSPCGITVDHSTHMLFWSDISAGRIEAAGLDGSHRRTLNREQVGETSLSHTHCPGHPHKPKYHLLNPVSLCFLKFPRHSEPIQYS